jgi:hypothetical protein
MSLPNNVGIGELINRIIALEAERDEAIREHRQTLYSYRHTIAERDKARAFAKELQQVMLEPIACDVILPPATTIRKGVSFATLRVAIKRRKLE